MLVLPNSQRVKMKTSNKGELEMVETEKMEKDWKWVLIGTIISWLIGYIGADRFYKGQVGLGIVKLLTLGGFGLWYLIDAFTWTYKLGQVK